MRRYLLRIGRGTTDAALEFDFNKVLAELGKVPEQARVLDAGCGIGGSSIWLAENYQARVTGITLSGMQVKLATKHAARRKVSHLVDFQVANYCHAPFPDESFDVIWAVGRLLCPG